MTIDHRSTGIPPHARVIDRGRRSSGPAVPALAGWTVSLHPLAAFGAKMWRTIRRKLFLNIWLRGFSGRHAGCIPRRWRKLSRENPFPKRSPGPAARVRDGVQTGPRSWRTHGSREPV